MSSVKCDVSLFGDTGEIFALYNYAELGMKINLFAAKLRYWQTEHAS